MNKSHIVLGHILITLFCLTAAKNSSAVTVSFNDSISLNMYDEIEYHTATDEIDFFINEPIVCHTTPNLVINGLSAVITDPNNNLGITLPINNSVQYDVTNQTINAEINSADAACVTESNGLISDLIFRSGFDNGTTFTIEYLDVPDFVVLGQIVDYTIVVQNNSPLELTFDLLEYVSESSPQNQAYFSGQNVSWDCVNQLLPGVDCGDEILSRYGVNDVILQPGEFAEIAVSRTVSPQSILDERINLMAAIFVKNQDGDFIGFESKVKEAVVSENEAPQLSWLNSSLNTFLEDDSVGQTLSFRIDDESGGNFSVATIEQAIMSYNNKVSFSNVTVQQILSGVYDVNFTVTPEPDKFTNAQNSEYISIQVNDIFNVFSNTLLLEVDITPVNDAPSFDVNCTHLVLDPSPLDGGSSVSCDAIVGKVGVPESGVFTWNEFLVGVSSGPEENQTMTFEIAPGATGDPILDGLIIGSNVSDLWLLTTDGASGTATINLMVTDDGGTANGGVDQFLSSTDVIIELLPVTYTVSGSSVDFPTVDPASEITLRLNVGGDTLDLEVDANNANDFTFGYQLPDGAGYTVSIIGQTLANCSITAGGTGTIAGNDVNDLVVDCGP